MIEPPEDTARPDPAPAPGTTSQQPESQPEPHSGSRQPQPDLDRVERDLDGVETALGRLDDGTYWTDEQSGVEIPDEVLAADPTSRRA